MKAPHTTTPPAGNRWPDLIDSLVTLRSQISGVKYAPIGEQGEDRITFTLRGQTYVGTLRGRNRDLCLGFGDEADRAIAVRVLLDCDAEIV